MFTFNREEETFEDFARRYTGCVGVISYVKGGAKKHIKVRGFDGDPSNFVVLYHALEKTDKGVFAWTERRSVQKDIENIDLIFPDMGLYNLNNGLVIYTTQIPRRQWKFGWNHEIVQVNYCEPSASNVRLLTDNNIRYPNAVDPDVIACVFEQPVWYSVDEAVQQLNNGLRLAAALNTEFAIHTNLFNPDTYYLSYYNDIIGTVSTDGKITFQDAAKDHLLEVFEEHVGVAA